MDNYEEAVKYGYDKLQEKQNQTHGGEKDNSMFGKDILKELGINQKEHDDELLM